MSVSLDQCATASQVPIIEELAPRPVPLPGFVLEPGGLSFALPLMIRSMGLPRGSSPPQGLCTGCEPSHIVEGGGHRIHLKHSTAVHAACMSCPCLSATRLLAGHFPPGFHPEVPLHCSPLTVQSTPPRCLAACLLRVHEIRPVTNEELGTPLPERALAGTYSPPSGCPIAWPWASVGGESRQGKVPQGCDRRLLVQRGMS